MIESSNMIIFFMLCLLCYKYIIFLSEILVTRESARERDAA